MDSPAPEESHEEQHPGPTPSSPAIVQVGFISTAIIQSSETDLHCHPEGK